METPENDPDGILFTASETASLEAGGYEGAGWLFSIARIDETRIHELLCADMSGMEVFAKDADGNYYLYLHPTDVRYERATPEAMQADAEQWSMLCEWANNVRDQLTNQNELESISFNNSIVDICLARVVWMDDVKATLETGEYGPVALDSVDGTPWAEFIMQGWFTEAESEAQPEGEAITLALPDEDITLDFFPDNYVRVNAGGDGTLYQAMWYDETVSFTEALQGWYYAEAEADGLREPDTSLDGYLGEWSEKIAGRAYISIEKGLAPGTAKIQANWPDSAAVMNVWHMTARLDEEGNLGYELGQWEQIEFDEEGNDWTLDSSWEESGWFWLNDDGELRWHNNTFESDEDSTFIR